MVIATLMTVLIHGCVIDSLIDAGLGRSNFKRATRPLTHNAAKRNMITQRRCSGAGPSKSPGANM
jgi:hypothetical protein